MEIQKKKIKVEDGNVSCILGNQIMAIDMIVSGDFELNIKGNKNWYFKQKGKRIIGIGIGSKLGIAPFMTYTGNLQITKCEVILDNMEKVYLSTEKPDDRFYAINKSMTGINIKFEDLKKTTAHKKDHKTKLFNIENNIFDIKTKKKLDIKKQKDSKIIKKRFKRINAVMNTQNKGSSY
jgi:hypothetical protein